MKKDSRLLDMISSRSKGDNRNEIGTLLRQTAAGPASHAELVEWMIHLGALVLPPMMHCWMEPDQAFPREFLVNAVAVHSAVIKRYEDVVMAILAADNFVELNTTTFHTNVTIAQLDVKNGNKMFCSIVVNYT